MVQGRLVATGGVDPADFVLVGTTVSRHLLARKLEVDECSHAREAALSRTVE